MKNFIHEQTELYEKTLHMASLIYMNQKSKKKDTSLISAIKRSYREVLSLQGRAREELKAEDIKPQKSVSPLKKHYLISSPLPHGKSYLNRSIEESNHYIKLSRAGKSSVRYSSRLQPSVRKLAINSTEGKPLPHVSILDGKMTQPLQLPLFEDYSNSNELTEEAQNKVLVNLERCEKTLQNFYKRLGGLELFCSTNPGVPWNNDKKILHKLYENPSLKASLIRNYNEKNLELKNKSTISRISFAQKKFSSSHSSFDSNALPPRAASPVAEDKLHSIQEAQRPQTPVLEEPEVILDRCLSRFGEARLHESKKLEDIFKRLKNNRPWYLRQKWEFIMRDSDTYKNKLDTLMKFKKIKREVNSRQEKRLQKNKSQAKIYFEMLEVLKENKGVKDIQVGFVNFIKGVLEEGWLISKELIEDVRRSLSVEEKEDLKEIIKVLEEKI